MRLTVYTSLAIFATFELGFAGPPTEGPPPVVVQQVAQVTAGGHLWLRNTVWRPVFETTTVEEPYTVEVIVVENGKRIKVPETRVRLVRVTHCKFVGELITRHLNIGDVETFEFDGTRLENIADAAGKLSSETQVLVSTTGDPPPVEFLSVFQPGTLVLVPPSASASGPPTDVLPPDAAAPAPEFSTQQPQRNPPEMTFASVSKDGRMKLTNRHIVQFETKIASPTGERRGAAQTPSDVIRGTDTQTRVRALNSSTATFSDAKGAALTTAQASEQLKRETLLLESSDGMPPDPFYLRLIRKGVLVMSLSGEPKQQSNVTPVAVPAPLK